MLLIGVFFFFLGEFTLRAFLNGRLDLSQAENVARLISAKSVAAADAALEGIQACIIQLCFHVVGIVFDVNTYIYGCVAYEDRVVSLLLFDH